jgi:hypothetical protein
MLRPLKRRQSSRRCNATRNVPDRPGAKTLTSKELSYMVVGAGHVAQVFRPEAFHAHARGQAYRSTDTNLGLDSGGSGVCWCLAGEAR